VATVDHGDSKMKLIGTLRPARALEAPCVAILLLAFAAIAAGCATSGNGSTAAPRDARTPSSGAATGTRPTHVTDTTAETGAPHSPCSLVTVADIAVVTGAPMTVSGTDGVQTCVYLSADKTKQFSVQILSGRPAMATVLQLEPSAEHIAGLGDDAFWSGGTILFVRVGDRGVSLSSTAILDTSNIDAGKAAMTALATKAITNLG
jgi:hypothetical protein